MVFTFEHMIENETSDRNNDRCVGNYIVLDELDPPEKSYGCIIFFFLIRRSFDLSSNCNSAERRLSELFKLNCEFFVIIPKFVTIYDCTFFFCNHSMNVNVMFFCIT